MDDRFNSFTTLISSIYRNIYLIKDFETSVYGLKSNHVSCLYNLARFGELTQVELIQICQENKAAISRTINFLMENGYIEISNSDMVYKKKYSLTEKGKRMSEVIENRITSILDAASGDISDLKRIEMYKALSHIDENLKEYIKNNSK